MTDAISKSAREQLIAAQIVARLAEHAGMEPVEIDAEDNLLTSGLVDSVGMMRLIADLEEELGVSVPPPDLVPENFRTVQVMARYLDGLSAG